MESEQLRRENDSSGPQDELEYWKRRGAQFSQLLSHLQVCIEFSLNRYGLLKYSPHIQLSFQHREVQWTLFCLSCSGSKILKQWKETDKKITFCYNEARDNSKFIQAMEQCCHSLYLDDPVNMRESIVSLLQTVRLIYSVSQFYNTSERTSTLMVKVNIDSVLIPYSKIPDNEIIIQFADHKSNDRNMQILHHLSWEGDDLVTRSHSDPHEISQLFETKSHLSGDVLQCATTAVPPRPGAIRLL